MREKTLLLFVAFLFLGSWWLWRLTDKIEMPSVSRPPEKITVEKKKGFSQILGHAFHSKELPENWPIYTSRKYPYSIRYPPELTVIEKGEVPEEQAKDEVDFVIVDKRTNRSALVLEVQVAEKKFDRAYIEKSLKRLPPGVEFKMELVEVSGLPATKVLIPTAENRAMMNLYVPWENLTFIFLGPVVTSRGQGLDFGPVVEPMIESFRIEKG